MISDGIRPVVRGFVKTYLLQAQLIAVNVLVCQIQNMECLGGQVFGGRNAVEHDGLVTFHGIKELGHHGIAGIDQEGMVPWADNMLLGNRLDIGIIHHHTLLRRAGGLDDAARQGDLDGITVPVQMAALALMLGDAVACIEFESARNEHRAAPRGMVDTRGLYHCAESDGAPGGEALKSAVMPEQMNVFDHNRDSAGLTYVYPVISRRAGGVSVGINLNPNNACNWRCVYCQVPDLKRGSAPEVDLDKLGRELRGFLYELLHGDFMEQRVPVEARRINDIALSGNGEPTSAKEFDRVIELVGGIMAEFDLVGKIKLVLITNGSQIHRPQVRAGLRNMATLGGEVWFKLDSVTREGLLKINGSRQKPEKMHGNLRVASRLCPTWLQTCVFSFDGHPPDAAERAAYLEFIASLAAEQLPLRGILLYGLARPSMQPDAHRLSRLPVEWMKDYAAEIERRGFPVKLSD